jgi:agmatinase
MARKPGRNGQRPDVSERTADETWPDTRALPRSFYGAPLCPDLNDLKAQVAFLGVPFDQGTSGRPGARYGPDGLRDARTYNYYSWQDDSEAPGIYDIDTGVEHLKGVTMADIGNISVVPSDVERNFWKITRVVRKALDANPLLVVVGGDHAVTGPVVRGFDRFSKLDIVHFDAHLDFTDHNQGIKWGHGSPIRRASEFANVRNITQLGIRLGGKKAVEEARGRGNRIITTDTLRDIGPEAAVAHVPDSDAMYVTLDIDVLDPAFAPGTGTPAPGGLTYFELRDALRALAKRGRIVGIDLVELAPPYDCAEITTRTASKLLTDFLAAIFGASTEETEPEAGALRAGS